MLRPSYRNLFDITKQVGVLVILMTSKVKVKVTLVQALRFCTGRTAHREIRGITLAFHDHGTRRGLGVSVTPLLLLP